MERATHPFLWFWLPLGIMLSGATAAAQTLPIPYVLGRPAGDGPFPAVVILHDCSGLGPRSSGAPMRWSAELTRRGYVTIWPDSFTTRGRPDGVCTDANRAVVDPAKRVEDANAALLHLRTLPYVDGRRIAVMGGSHGGTSTLETIVERGQAATAPRFTAAIALYPTCGRAYGTWSARRNWVGDTLSFSYAGVFQPTAPLLILSGALDDWTPAEPCRRMAEIAKSAGYAVEIEVYPDAHHSFDSAVPVRFVAERINAHARGGRGATTGGNAEAWKAAIARVEAFLGHHLANPSTAATPSPR